MPQFTKAELDLLKAEGLLRTGGSTQRIADLINEMRVTDGGPSPAKAENPRGQLTDGSWTQTEIHRPGASLWAKLQHEFRLETFGTTGALAWAMDRRWGDLVDGTPTRLTSSNQSVLLAFRR